MNMLEDFLKVCDELGSAKNGGLNCPMESRLLTNFSCGMLYIQKEWEFTTQDEKTDQ